MQTRLYITRAEDWEAVGRAHGEVLGEIRPAAAMLVTGLLDPRMLVEIEATAYVGGGDRGLGGGGSGFREGVGHARRRPVGTGS